MRIQNNEHYEKPRIFVDMDGTLAEWRNIKIEFESLEDTSPNEVKKRMDKVLYAKDYFRTLKPNEEFVSAVKSLIKERQVEVYVLSCVLPNKDGVSPIEQKNEWLDEYLPELAPSYRVFVPNGEDKKDYIPNGIRSTDVLIDDYTKNLILWEEKGRGLKFLNDVNATNGTWNKSMISYKESPETLKKAVEDFVLQNKEIYHDVPDKNENFITDLEFLKSER